MNGAIVVAAKEDVFEGGRVVVDVDGTDLTSGLYQSAASLRRRTSSSSVLAAQSSAATISSPSRP
jgi:hypothetical protein